MSLLSEQEAKEMRDRARAVKERMAAGANFTREWNLTGKNTIVEPGRAVIVRLLPRWDYGQSMLPPGPDGKRAPNPAYKGGRKYVVANEHWWQDGEGKWNQEWCPCSLTSTAACLKDCSCSVCQASRALVMSAVKEDKEFGNGIRGREVFIFNAVVGNPRKLGQDGKADIRILKATGVIYNYISDIMTGTEENPQFARGDITNPRDGYDLEFKRPVKSGGDRWVVTSAPNPSPLYAPEQREVFAGWLNRLVDLEAMIQKDTKDAAGLFKAFYGRDPEAGELKGGTPVASTPAVAPAVNGGGYDEDLGPGQAAAPAVPSVPNQPPASPDDEFMPFSATPQAPRPATAAARAPRR